MTVERHYDDEVLMSMVGNEAAQAAARRQHLADCLTCAETLESYRGLADCLGEEALWDLHDLPDAPVPQTIANLRAFASEMDREGAQAEAILRELIAGPRESWMPRLQQHPEWRTAGVVRKLIAATDRAIDTMPPDAVALTALATDIADHLPPSLYASDTVLKLRGAAWRERAYALDYVGQYDGALAAADRCDQMLGAAAIADFDEGRASLVRARILRNLDRGADALVETRGAAAIFARAGDETRGSYARFTEAMILYKLRRTREALALFTSLESACARDQRTAAMLTNNIAHCHRELGEFDHASRAFERAMRSFDHLHLKTEAIRARWSSGKMLAAQGHVFEASTRFAALRQDLLAKGMFGEYLLATLDLAETLLVIGRREAAVDACRELLSALTNSGMRNLELESSTVALLKEAAAERNLTPAKVSEVKRRLHRTSKVSERRLFVAAPDFYFL